MKLLFTLFLTVLLLSSNTLVLPIDLIIRPDSDNPVPTTGGDIYFWIKGEPIDSGRPYGLYGSLGLDYIPFGPAGEVWPLALDPVFEFFWFMVGAGG
ncbi:MAG: hypothetical protein ACYTG7_17545, partial [Planctomycetota bacterium]